MKGIYICQCCRQAHQFTYPDRQPNVPPPARITAPCDICTAMGCGGIKTFLPAEAAADQRKQDTTFYFKATCGTCGTTIEVESKTGTPVAPACPNGCRTRSVTCTECGASITVHAKKGEVMYLPACPECGAAAPDPTPDQRDYDEDTKALRRYRLYRDLVRAGRFSEDLPDATTG